jgi:hypothetical protein
MKQNIVNVSRNSLPRDNNQTFATCHQVAVIMRSLNASSSLVLRMVELAMFKKPSLPYSNLPKSNPYPELAECASYFLTKFLKDIFQDPPNTAVQFVQ